MRSRWDPWKPLGLDWLGAESRYSLAVTFQSSNLTRVSTTPLPLYLVSCPCPPLLLELLSTAHSVVSGVMFNRFTPLDETVLITIVVDGQEQQVPGKLYRCEGTTSMGICRLVWDRARLAKECADHDHRQSWVHEYVSRDGTVQRFTRSAVRRDGRVPSVPSVAAPAPVTVAAQAVALSPEDQLRQLADSLGFRVSRKPAPKPKADEFVILEDSGELPF